MNANVAVNQAPKSKKTISISKMNARAGYLFALPWFLGFLLFTALPFVQAMIYSFMDYDIITTPRWVGLSNYIAIFHDRTFYTALYNTFYYVIFAVPMGIIIGLLLAMLLNQEIKGIALYRTLFYMPSIVPSVAATVLWSFVFRPNNGILTVLVEFFGVRAPAWLADPKMAKNSLIIMSLWTAGGGLIIYLAGLKNISKMYYESADLDGAGVFRKFFSITLPLLSPTLLYQLVMGMIGGFQVFMQAYILTSGGPNQATYFYAYYIFDNAFRYWKMGYACALSWILFAIIMVFTLINLGTSSKWVHYN